MGNHTSGYRYVLRHGQGKDNANVDVLSRLLLPMEAKLGHRATIRDGTARGKANPGPGNSKTNKDLRPTSISITDLYLRDTWLAMNN